MKNYLRQSQRVPLKLLWPKSLPSGRCTDSPWCPWILTQVVSQSGGSTVHWESGSCPPMGCMFGLPPMSGEDVYRTKHTFKRASMQCIEPVGMQRKKKLILVEYLWTLRRKDNKNLQITNQRFLQLSNDGKDELTVHFLKEIVSKSLGKPEFSSCHRDQGNSSLRDHTCLCPPWSTVLLSLFLSFFFSPSLLL